MILKVRYEICELKLGGCQTKAHEIFKKTNKMNFTLTEKLALAKALDEIILADGEVKHGELAYLSQLSSVVGFDVELIRQSRNLSLPEAITALSSMTEEKNRYLP